MRYSTFAIELREFNVPIGLVEKLLPRRVTIVGELDVDDRITPRLEGFVDQSQTGLLRCTAPLLDVASVTGTDHVLPRRRSVVGSRDDVVEAQFRRGEPPAAILTGVRVPREDVAAVELHLVPRDPRERQNSYDPRDDEIEADRANPIMLRRFELTLECAQLRPVAEVVRNVSPVLDMNDLGDGLKLLVLFEQKRERPADADNSQGCVVRVEQKDVPVERGRRIDCGVDCEDDTSLGHVPVPIKATAVSPTPIVATPTHRRNLDSPSKTVATPLVGHEKPRLAPPTRRGATA